MSLMKETITMTKEQIRRAHVLRKYQEGLMSRKEAATALRLTERQITRLAKGLKEEGEAALIHKNTGRKPAHAITPEAKARIVEIRQQWEYKDCNVNHFRELLERMHQTVISYDPLYRLLKESGIESPKKHRRTKAHRLRKRKASEGDMMQIDATPHDWFGDGRKSALHGTIDDATGKLTGLYMTENECLQGYFEVMRQTCLNFGIPLSVYSDRHTIFRSPKTKQSEESGEEATLTQFGRALDELGINIIHAQSPQAKGRIERVWETLQSRLPVEFRLAEITTIEQANTFLAEVYIKLFNEEFSVKAADEPIYVPYTHGEDIDNILCIKEQRTLDSAGSFSFQRRTFKILDEGYPIISAKTKVEVLVSVRQTLRVRYKGRVYQTAACIKPQKTTTGSKSKYNASDLKRQHVKPHLLHSSDAWRKLWHYESYEDSLDFLYDLFFKPSA